ncbi:MAG: ATP-grasp domain-containing protein [Desulfamplus sp.]|nr:ATP-grasp domain-containing protein [Desulfamplus sp.]
MQQQRTLVVATTSDYIDILRHKFPEKNLLFITAPAIRAKAVEETPPADEELLCELDSSQTVIDNLKDYILNYDITLKGVACFDCESMELCANIALAFSLPYPSVETVLACRDKSSTRKIWHSNGVKTPEYARVSSAEQSVKFFEDVKMPCVLKPVDSSGSERVFRCTTSKECEEAYAIISSPQNSPDIIIETCVDGIEYSCDFIINRTVNSTQAVDLATGVQIKIGETSDTDRFVQVRETAYRHDVIPLRFTRKIHAPISVFGTIMAYEVVEFPAGNFLEEELLSLLAKAAATLGITRGICMVDFIVRSNSLSSVINYGDCNYEDSSGSINYGTDNRSASLKRDSIYLLEMTPRPGGDCLPWLIQKSMNIDILKLNLDLARQSYLEDTYSGTYKGFLNKPSLSKPLVGLRIHADQEGVLDSVNTQRVESDPRVVEVFIKHKSGHRIVLPPKDYDSWNLGHIIFNPYEDVPCKDQCINLLSMLKIELVALC